MLNRVVLVGRLTKEPDLRITQNGKSVANFTLAVNRNFKNAQGEQEADFLNVVQWNGAENTANYLKKGSLAGVDGKVQTRSYEGNDGKRVYVTEILAESVQFLDTKGNDSQKEKKADTGQQVKNDDPFAGGGQIGISDDDLPF
ncbi:single-stranded DNA-binding protein [Mesobacillus stamsii]|uniref:Single-stranded DNA-binding protein n=1 Tax=Mesobacillus stamsii TaxID=225347 RepID=A0ABU0FW95_9BACI|nr:single-stranded DNA-binding protein [Mesobacillus stamsii]MDQ0414198.1 single-strand DNA-binding protein [Mesobacillus stamsii]